MEEKLELEIDNMKILEADDDIMLVELDLLHLGKNRNQYTITKDVVERAIPTMYNKPIIYRLNNEFMPSIATDVVEHGTVEDRAMRIAGIIPESAPMEFVERNGKEYLRTRGIIYKLYQPSLTGIIKNRKGNLKVSIEIMVDKIDDEDNGGWIVNDFKFEGVALLGENVLEGIEGSQLNVIKFSAADLNERYLKFSSKIIPAEVKEAVKNALKVREEKGKGGSSASVSMAKYLASSEYIDYSRLNMIKDYFNGNPKKEGLSFSLYGGEVAREWVNGKRVENSMNTIPEYLLYDKVFEFFRETFDEEWRYDVDTIYIDPMKLAIRDNIEHKLYLVDYKIKNNKVKLDWENKKEIAKVYIPIEDVRDDTLMFTRKEILSVDENGQLISNTHRLSSVNSAEARKAETLLNSLEKVINC